MKEVLLLVYGRGACECAKFGKSTPKNAHVRVHVRLEFWQNAHVRAMCVRPKFECGNVRACEAKIRRNSQLGYWWHVSQTELALQIFILFYSR